MAKDELSSAIMKALMPKGKPVVSKTKVMVADDEPDDEGEDMDLGSEGLLSAMKDLLIAVHKSDPDAMAEAFKDAVDLVTQKADAPPEDNEGEDKKPSEYR